VSPPLPPPFALRRAPVAGITLPFEAPVVDLLDRVRELRKLANEDPALKDELSALEARTARVARELFNDLTRMQKVQLSRHPMRPTTLDYSRRLFTEWVELHGDRRFADDPSIVAGLASYHGRSVAVIGHQKGRTTKENMKRNFGMPNPEGYRKAIRLYELAERFRLPVLTFIDTPGAYPGLGAEERGQSEAIGASIATLSRLGVPVIATVIGEGGSGGALALGVANRVLMLELGCYSVISPEGCAAILWKDGSRAAEAAERMKVTAPDLLGFGIVDALVDEPPGGAHQDHDGAAERLDAALKGVLEELSLLSPEALRDDRYAKFRRMGVYRA
jgi:acetyl-CoA carboxylase carboxyl transferase subunit alpha